MRAIQLSTHGGPEVLSLVDLPDPEPGPGQILIDVRAAGVNFSDTLRRRDLPYPFPTPLPFVPGGEVAGVVAALGEGVDGPPVGTPVFALVGEDGRGGYAELALAAAHLVIPRPPSVSEDEAASIMVAGGTAAVLLRLGARMVEGDTVLVEAAGGGVGSFAVQLAKAFGAGRVIGAASGPERRSLALGLGADEVIDYGVSGWEQQVRDLAPAGVDVALQTTGAATMSGMLSCLAPFGRMVVYGYASGETGALRAEDQRALFYAPALNCSVSGFNIGAWFALRPEAAVPVLEELIGLVAQRRVEPQIGAVMALEDAAEAHRLLEGREVVGKVILRP